MAKSSTYQQIFPEKAELKKYIKLYYVHYSHDPDFYEQSTYFPNFTVTLNVYRHSKVVWDDLSRTHLPDPQVRFQILLVGKFDKSRSITTQGKFQKLSIVFHPLGLNHFVKEPLATIIQDHFSFFNYFGPAFDKLLDRVFAMDDLEKKRVLLDDFFIQNWCGFEEERLIHAVNRILNTNGQIPVKQLADELNISRKTLFRLFKKHLDYSPTEYRSIVKFRKALHNYQSKTSKPNLSSLAYESDYYDQSDFNHQFKEKTGCSPQQLFAQLKTIDKGLYWSIQPVPKVQDNEDG